MKSDNNRISPRQSFILIALYVFCSAIVLMPVFSVSGAGTAGCISALLSVILMFIPLLVVYALMKHRKNGSFYEILTNTTNKFTANILYILYVVKTIILTALMLKLFSQTMRIFLLPKTPLCVTTLVMLLLCAYIASKGIEARGRLGEIVIFLIGIPFLLVFITACFSIKPEYISQSLSVPVSDMAKAGVLTFLSFLSIDFILLHLPFCAQRRKSAEQILFCAPISAFAAVIAVFIAIACFGPYAAAKQSALIPEIMNVIKLPATLIERHDLLNMFFWILILFHLISTFIFFACIAFKDTAKKPSHPVCILIMLPFIYALTFVPFEIHNIYIISGIINAASNIVTFVLVIILLIFGKEHKNA